MASSEWGLISETKHSSYDVSHTGEGTTVTNTKVISYHFIKHKVWPTLGQRSPFTTVYTPVFAPPWTMRLKFVSPPPIYVAGQAPARDTESPLSPLVDAFTAGASTSLAGQRMPPTETPQAQPQPDEDVPLAEHTGTDWTNNKETMICCLGEPDHEHSVAAGSQPGETYPDRIDSPVPPPRLPRPVIKALGSPKSNRTNQSQFDQCHNVESLAQTPALDTLETTSSSSLLCEPDFRSAAAPIPMPWLSQMITVHPPSPWSEQLTRSPAPSDSTGRLPYGQLSCDSINNGHPYLELSQEGCTLGSGKPVSTDHDYISPRRNSNVLTSNTISASNYSRVISQQTLQRTGESEGTESSPAVRDRNLSKISSLPEDPNGIEREGGSLDLLTQRCGRNATEGSSWRRFNTQEKLLTSGRKRKRKPFQGNLDNPGQTTSQMVRPLTRKNVRFDRCSASHAQSAVGFDTMSQGCGDQTEKLEKPWRLKCPLRRSLQGKPLASAAAEESTQPAEPSGDRQFRKPQRQGKPFQYKSALSRQVVGVDSVGAKSKRAAPISTVGENRAMKPMEGNSNLGNISEDRSEGATCLRHGNDSEDATVKSRRCCRWPRKESGFLNMGITRAPYVTHEDFAHGKCSHVSLFEPMASGRKRHFSVDASSVSLVKSSGLVSSNASVKDSRRAFMSGRRYRADQRPSSVPSRLTSMGQSDTRSATAREILLNSTNFNDNLVCPKFKHTSVKLDQQSESHITNRGHCNVQSNCLPGSVSKQRGKAGRNINRRQTTSLSPSKSTVVPKPTVKSRSFSIRSHKSATDSITLRPQAYTTVMLRSEPTDKLAKSRVQAANGAKNNGVVVKKIKRNKKIISSDSETDTCHVTRKTSSFRKPAGMGTTTGHPGMDSQGTDACPMPLVKHVNFNLSQPLLKRKRKVSEKTGAGETSNLSKANHCDCYGGPKHCQARARLKGQGAKKRKASFCDLGVQTDGVFPPVRSPPSSATNITQTCAETTVTDFSSQTGAGDYLTAEYAQIFNDPLMAGDPLNSKVETTVTDGEGHPLHGLSESSQSTDHCNSANYYYRPGSERANVRSVYRLVSQLMNIDSDDRMSIDGQASEEGLHISGQRSLHQGLSDISMLSLGIDLGSKTGAKLFTFV